MLDNIQLKIKCNENLGVICITTWDTIHAQSSRWIRTKYGTSVAGIKTNLFPISNKFLQLLEFQNILTGSEIRATTVLVLYSRCSTALHPVASGIGHIKVEAPLWLEISDFS
jgi:hypothetical protein